MDLLADDWLPEGTIRIPLLGDVAAGQPLEMFSVEESLDVPESLWNGRKVFALRVRGQSMVDAGIRDGDYLIIEPCETADDGRTVVAEVDGHVTVKKIFRTADGEIRLQPANPEMLPLVVRAQDVRVRGIVVGVLRKYGFNAPPTRETVSSVPPVGAPPRRSASSDESTLELSLNAIDAHLERWKILFDQNEQKLNARDRVRMSNLARDLQALRDWCARTSKPALRKALIADAGRLMQRMQRFLAARSLELPDMTLH